MMKKRKRIELVNAQTKDRGLDYLPVRGLVKAKAIALWHALTHNLMTAIRLNAVTMAGIHLSRQNKLLAWVSASAGTTPEQQ